MARPSLYGHRRTHKPFAPPPLAHRAIAPARAREDLGFRNLSYGMSAGKPVQNMNLTGPKIMASLFGHCLKALGLLTTAVMAVAAAPMLAQLLS